MNVSTLLSLQNGLVLVQFKPGSTVQNWFRELWRTMIHKPNLESRFTVVWFGQFGPAVHYSVHRF